MDKATPKIDAMIKDNASKMNAEQKKALTKCKEHLLQFKKDKEQINKDLDAKKITVDQACEKATKLRKTLGKDMEQVAKVFPKQR